MMSVVRCMMYDVKNVLKRTNDKEQIINPIKLITEYKILLYCKFKNLIRNYMLITY